ncbi:MAG: hypothetical protein PHQ45_02395 [Acidaminococcaceae bacterium]|jgi:hypothetical protein|nr:hypothetical protein [Acidaminococcaceae bacterium]
MNSADIDKDYKDYLEVFKGNEELGKELNLVTFEKLFNPEFLQAYSSFKDMNELIWRSDFGIMNLMEVEQVNQEKWNAYIAQNTQCQTWFEFGKLAMIEWMKKAIEANKNKQN